MKKIGNSFWKRCLIIGLLIILQIVWLSMVLHRFRYQYTYANYAIRGLAVVVALRIINRWMNPNNKVSWTFIILVSPVTGLLLYLIFGREGITQNAKSKMATCVKTALRHTYQTPEINQFLQVEDKLIYRQSKYINDWSGYPIYGNTKTTYYKCGEEMFPDMLLALESAEKFIFLEYYIIEEGTMFDRIIEVLERKVKDGVEVRLIYDDMGSISKIPHHYYEVIRQKGIACVAFNPFLPVLSIVMNHRDHRKILVIDGKIGFTGGINLADEYINRKERFGYWKDTGICLEGEAVFSLTLMFLSMWDYINDIREDMAQFCMVSDNFSERKNWVEKYKNEKGFVQPYADSPLDSENVGEGIYLNIINQAMDYVYIFTPYLIIGNEMLLALCNAAKRGVDVRIVLPGIPDKKMIFILTQSYYKPLIQNGVKVYQYRPGFLHAKNFLCDDKIATIGSVNLDYRSLYLNFECGVYLYKCDTLKKIKQDFKEVFASSDEITIAYCDEKTFIERILQGILRLLAPLL